MSKSLKRLELKFSGGVLLKLVMGKSLKRLELKDKGGVSLNIVLSKSLSSLELKETGDEQKSEKTRVDFERRSVIKLTTEQKSEKARVETKRWNVVKLTYGISFEKARVEAKKRAVQNSQAASIRLMDKRNSYATRSTTIADRAISNELVLGRELNIVQLGGNPLIPSAQSARASREVQSDAQQRKVSRVRALRRRQKNIG